MTKFYEYCFEYDEYITSIELVSKHIISRRFLVMPSTPLTRTFINREIVIKTKYLLVMENAI